MVVDPVEQSLSFIGQLQSGTICMYSSICCGPDDTLFLSPENAPNIMVLRPQKNEMEFIRSTRLEESSKYVGICYDSRSKKLYCSAFNNSSLMIVDPRPVLEVAREYGGDSLVKAFKQSECDARHPNHDRVKALSATTGSPHSIPARRREDSASSARERSISA